MKEAKIERFTHPKNGIRFKIVNLLGEMLHDGNQQGFKSVDAAIKLAHYYKLHIIDDAYSKTNLEVIDENMKQQLRTECIGFNKLEVQAYLRACCVDSTPLRIQTAKQILAKMRDTFHTNKVNFD